MDKNSILLYIKLPCVEQQAVKYQTTFRSVNCFLCTYRVKLLMAFIEESQLHPKDKTRNNIS